MLISGGGSALLPAPAAGISLKQKIALNDALLASGLDIHDMNDPATVFRIKGRAACSAGGPGKNHAIFAV